MNDDQTLQLILTIAVVILTLEQIIIGFVVWSVVTKARRLVIAAEEIVETGKDTLRTSVIPKSFRIAAAVWNMWKKKSK